MSILHDFRRRDAKDRKSQITHILVASLVVLDREIVNETVDLDNQLGRGTVEVGDIWADRMMAPELDAARRTAKK
jgi:hypothetical protein